MRTRIALLLMLAGGLADGPLARCAEEGAFQEIIPEQEQAVEKALAWLAKAQRTDGSWQAGGGDNLGGYPCAMTALAGMAMVLPECQ